MYTTNLIGQLIDHGIYERNINGSRLASLLEGYDIYPEQIHRGNSNRNGYKWSNFDRAWSIYLSKDEKDLADVECVDSVDREGGRCPANDSCGLIPLGRSTVSTISTKRTDGGVSSSLSMPPSITDYEAVRDGREPLF
jgi:hypothetical protein